MTSFQPNQELLMRRMAYRALFGFVALSLGILSISNISSADPAKPSEVKFIVEQDKKLVKQLVDAGKLTTKGEKQAMNGFGSQGLYLAVIANSAITGKDAATDGKMAAIRDLGIKIAVDAKKKDWKSVEKLNGELLDPKPATDAKAMKVEDILKATGIDDVDTTMQRFRNRANTYGAEIETVLKNAAKKKSNLSNDELQAIAQHVIALGEVSKHVTKTANAKQKQDWDKYNAEMIKEAQNLATLASKKSTAADVQKSLTLIDAKCTACHNDFK